MHECTGWQSTKTSCAMDTVICIHNMATSFNNISSSKFSAKWRATSTYVGLCSTAHVIAVDVISPGTCALTQMASNSQYTLPPQSSPQKNHRSEIADTLKMKLKRHIIREFLCYWWLFWMQHLSRYGARLFEEERRRRWTILTYDYFRFATLT